MTLYVPRHFNSEMPDRDARTLMREHPFATLVTPADDDLHVSHLPLLHRDDGSAHGQIHGHLARANPHARELRGGSTLAIFHGPHAYVSPNWYAAPDSAVPTWNYAVVHARGPVTLLEEPAHALEVLTRLTQVFEGDDPATAWSPERARTTVDRMLPGIVAFRIDVVSLDVKLKMSQNRPAGDRDRVRVRLAGGGAEERAVARWIATGRD